MRLIIPLFIVLVSNNYALATSCAGNQSFAETSAKSPVIVDAWIVSQGCFGGISPPTPECMDIRVVKVYKGKPVSGLLRVYGDNGNSARRYVNLYPKGTRWIFALTKEFGYWPVRDKRASVYAFPGCADPALAVISGQVFGALSERYNESFSLTGLTQRLNFAWKNLSAPRLY